MRPRFWPSLQGPGSCVGGVRARVWVVDVDVTDASRELSLLIEPCLELLRVRVWTVDVDVTDASRELSLLIEPCFELLRARVWTVDVDVTDASRELSLLIEPCLELLRVVEVDFTDVLGKVSLVMEPFLKELVGGSAEFEKLLLFRLILPIRAWDRRVTRSGQLRHARWILHADSWCWSWRFRRVCPAAARRAVCRSIFPCIRIRIRSCENLAFFIDRHRVT
mmetsp:Transcript_30506/g.54835  ORF Transcript_30506/g.54835 Transcript_30506/m.54835 type:complete len:222 (+) Transcript_30506:362-1027(+)